MYMAYSEFCSNNKLSAVKKEAFSRTLSKRFQWKDDSVRYGDKVYRIWIDRRLISEYEKIAQNAIIKIRQTADLADVLCQSCYEKRFDEWAQSAR